MGDLNTVLVVEDDKVFRQLLREVLERNDFLVIEAASGKRLIEILDQYSASLVLLDLNLPDGCALKFIPQIKNITDVPIIILSGEENDSKKVKSLDTGADDYIEKPFDPAMLVARLNAHIRRYREYHDESGNISHVNGNSSNGHNITFDCWTVDHLKFQIFDENAQSAELTHREYRLLEFLINNADRAIPREELCEAVREENYIPTPRALDVKITRIRKKIGDAADAPNIIQTVRGVGYIFNGDTIKTP